MDYFEVKPEVAGQIGPSSVLDASVHPPIVTRLEYEFYGWDGSELLESFPCFIVSESLAESMQDAGLSGFSLDDVKVSISPEYLSPHDQSTIPAFRWLKVNGTSGKDDVGLMPNATLVLSQRAKDVISPASPGMELNPYPSIVTGS